jgi:hypothetical protein
MFISPDSRLVISHFGWADESALWTYDVVKDSVNLVPVGNAKYLTLYLCKNKDQFGTGQSGGLHYNLGRTRAYRARKPQTLGR